MLRLAVLLRRGHRDKELPDIAMTASSNTVWLQFPEDWLQKHALTRADLEQEKKYLKAIKVVLEFED